jgi:hypothetical protein
VDNAARRALLERAAAAVGESWAREWLAELGSQGRPASGGWPGTMTQARSRVRPAMLAELSRARLASAEPHELDRSAHAAYSRAREVWLASARADADDEAT